MSRLIVLALCLAACGGGGGGGGGTSDGGIGGLSLEDYLTQGRNLECQLAVGCCQPLTNNVVYATVADCEAASPITNDLDLLTAAIAAKSVTYDASAAAACIAVLKPFATTCPATSTPAQVSMLDCPNVLTGALALGATCMPTDSLCAPGSFCDETAMTCKADVTNVGGACIACDASDNCTQSACGSGLYCNAFASANTCASLILDGGACTASAYCVSGYCDDTGKCALHPDYMLLELCTPSTDTKM